MAHVNTSGLHSLATLVKRYVTQASTSVQELTMDHKQASKRRLRVSKILPSSSIHLFELNLHLWIHPSLLFAKG